MLDDGFELALSIKVFYYEPLIQWTRNYEEIQPQTSYMSEIQWFTFFFANVCCTFIYHRNNTFFDQLTSTNV